MANVRFAYDFDTWDGATITSSSEETNLPDDNVVDAFVSKVWRATGDSSEWIKFDLGSAVNIKMVGLFNHNLSSGATVKLQANATDVWTSPSYDVTLTWNAYKIVKFLDETYRWWRITFADGSNPDNYIEVGRIVGGDYLEPTYNIVDGFTKGLVDPSYIKPVEGLETYASARSKYWTYTLSWLWLTRAVQDDLQDMFETIGTTERLVVSLDPTNYPSKDSIYCMVRSDFLVANRFQDYADIGLTFVEQK